MYRYQSSICTSAPDYGIRSGRRLDDDGRVQVLPVTTENGRIRVAIDVETGAR